MCIKWVFRDGVLYLILVLNNTLLLPNILISAILCIPMFSFNFIKKFLLCILLIIFLSKLEI
jgi:hypothetical protein